MSAKKELPPANVLDHSLNFWNYSAEEKKISESREVCILSTEKYLHRYCFWNYKKKKHGSNIAQLAYG